MALSVKNMLGGSGQQTFPYVWGKYEDKGKKLTITGTPSTTSVGTSYAVLNNTDYYDSDGNYKGVSSISSFSDVEPNCYYYWVAQNRMVYTVTVSSTANPTCNYYDNGSWAVSEVRNFIEDVTSFDVNAYPSDGEQGGYYYKRKAKPPYAWGKYENKIIPTGDEVYVSWESSNNTLRDYYISTEINGNTLVNPTKLNISYSSGNQTIPPKSYMALTNLVDSSSGVTITQTNYSAESGSYIFYFENGGTLTRFSMGTMYGFKILASEFGGGYKAMDFLEYVTDKNPLKYPNGEVADDGFFYRYANEGLYIWEKYELQKVVNTNISGEFYWQKTASNKTVTWYMSNTFTEENGQFVLDNPTTYAQSYGNYTTSGAQYLIADSPRGTKMAILPAGGWIYNAATGVYVSTGGTSKQMNTYSYENVFIDYIISDKEDAYPSDGEMDGYYYKKSGGGAKVSYGTIASGGGSAKAITIEHGLGTTPRHVLITYVATSSIYSQLVCGYYDEDGTGRVVYTNGSKFTSISASSFLEVDDVNITLNKYSVYYWYTPLHWVAIA